MTDLFVELDPVSEERRLQDAEAEECISKFDQEEFVNWDKNAYYSYMREVRTSLGRSEYRSYYRSFGEWKKEAGKCWTYCWEAEAQRLLCEQDSSKTVCQPDDYKQTNELLNFLKDNEIYSLYGPTDEEWFDKVDFICSELGEDSNVCLNLSLTDTGTFEGVAEISIF